MKKVIIFFSSLSLVTLILVGCSVSDENNAQKVAKEFGSKIDTVDSKNSSLLVDKQQKAVKNSIEYIKNSSFSSKNSIDIDSIKIENAVDTTDWIITIGSTSDHDFAIIICDSNTSEVIGNIPIK